MISNVNVNLPRDSVVLSDPQGVHGEQVEVLIGSIISWTGK